MMTMTMMAVQMKMMMTHSMKALAAVMIELMMTEMPGQMRLTMVEMLTAIEFATDGVMVMMTMTAVCG